MHGHALVGQREHLVRARARVGVRVRVRVGVRVRVRVRVRLRVRPGSVSAWWGWLTPALAMVTEWPSRWRMVREKPRRACRRVRRSTIERSAPSRLKTRCGAVSSCRCTSPGTMPGVCSDARSKLIVAPGEGQGQGQG